MKREQTIRDILIENKDRLAAKYKIKSMGLFGSYARGESTAESDVDVLIEFTESPDIFEFIRIEESLTELLGCKVDLVTKKALKEPIQEDILRETVYI